VPIVPSGEQKFFLSFIFRPFLDDKIIVWPWAMILSSRNSLNIENTFVDLIEQVAQSKSDNSYVP
jgi:hypothetical protein